MVAHTSARARVVACAMSSLFQRLGGDAAVDAAVDSFYKIVLEDPRISFLFEGIDTKRLAGHQKLFLKYAFGGLPNYSGKNMREAHARLPLTATHFDAVLDDLAKALRGLGVTEDLIAEVAAIAETTRGDVLAP